MIEIIDCSISINRTAVLYAYCSSSVENTVNSAKFRAAAVQRSKLAIEHCRLNVPCNF